MRLGRLSAEGVPWRPLAFYVPAITLVLVILVRVVFSPPGTPVEQIAGPPIGLFDLCALVISLAILRRRKDLDQRTRRAWAWFAASRAVGFASGIAFIALNSKSFPAPGDVLRLTAGLILLVSLLMFPRREGGRLERHKLALDVGSVVVAGAMVMWYLVVGPALASSALPGDQVAGAIAYPIGDLLVLFAVTMVIRRGVDASVRIPLYFIAAGFLFEITGNSYLGYLRSHPGWLDRSGWQMWCYLVSHFGLAAAAFEQLRRRATGPAAAPAHDRAVNRMPYLGIGLSVVLLMVAALREENAYPWAGLVLGTVAITAIGSMRQALALRENHEMAITDALTGLANRARLHDALGRSLVRAQRSGGRVGVLLADLNGFKEVNDTLGHAAGDQLLREFAAMLSRAVLGGDVVGRLGGDEFAVVLHDIGSAENAQAVIRRLHAEMELPIMVGDVVVKIRAAVGYTLSEPGELDLDEVLRRADEEMYRIKKAGKAGTDLNVDEEMAEDLRHAVEAGQLRAHYQPIVSLPEGSVIGVEALLRWEHPTRGMVPPLTFIPIAERTGAIVEIGGWILEEACAQVARWRAEGHDLYLTVNLSPRQLLPGLADRVAEVLDRVGLDPRHLIAEVTESVEIGDPAAVEQLEMLRAHGVRIALDDFGTGYATLQYLTMLPVDILKIDRAFVATLNGTPNGATVVETLLRMSRMMLLDTVAEGVESPHQAAELHELGCPNAQGYHFAKPMPAGEIQAMLGATV